MEINLKDICVNDKLESINITFKENEISTIIDKDLSTLFNLLYGLKTIDSGDILIDGNKLSLKEYKRFIKSNIYYSSAKVDQSLFNINILEDIKYTNKHIDRNKLLSLLESFYLTEDILNKHYLELSSGEQRKICLIDALLSDKKVLLLDNPTGCLDYKSIQSLVKVLKREKREGKIIIIISNNSEFLLQISDRVIGIKDKKVFIDSDKYSVLSNTKYMNDIGLKVPNILEFKNRVIKLKKINLNNRDNINDLIKDIYRYAK